MPADLFLDPTADPEARITDLLARMTLPEKIAAFGGDPSVPRLGLKCSRSVEGLHGLAQDGPANWLPKRRVKTTTFPQSYGLGQSWDFDLIRRVAEVEATEARYVYHKYKQEGIIIFAPNADLGRDPRWGRTEECFGECATLVGALSLAFVRGLQGDHPKYWRAASLMKHFLANSNEDDRESSSSNFDMRLWREYYSVGFRRGIIEGGARAYMAAYNAHNGVPCHIHPMLSDITRDEWGFDGQIITDGGGYKLLRTHHKAAKTQAEAATKIVKASIGRFLDNYRVGLTKAVEKGDLTEQDLDAALRGNYRVQMKLGSFDPPEMNPYTKIADGPEPWLSAEHQAVAREATQKGIVLLKNEGILPLVRGKVKRIAIVGNCADHVFVDWYSGMPPYFVTPFAGLQELSGAEVVTATGGDEAIRLAKAADIVIVAVGNEPVGELGWAKVAKPSYGKEGIDRESLDLEDEALVRACHAVNPNTILVLTSSFPYAINWSQANLPAIIHMAHNSQEQGRALAEVIMGDVNPAGRLTQTWVKSLADLPPKMDYDLRNGRTYMYFTGEPLYPFGHGLSYSTFNYSNLKVERDNVTVDITNSSNLDGEEVVQLYVRYKNSPVPRPNQELKAFARVAISAGKTITVKLALPDSALHYWNEQTNSWAAEPGEVEIQIGTSSQDIRLTAKR